MVLGLICWLGFFLLTKTTQYYRLIFFSYDSNVQIREKENLLGSSHANFGQGQLPF